MNIMELSSNYFIEQSVYQLVYEVGKVTGYELSIIIKQPDTNTNPISLKSAIVHKSSMHTLEISEQMSFWLNYIIGLKCLSLIRDFNQEPQTLLGPMNMKINPDVFNEFKLFLENTPYRDNQAALNASFLSSLATVLWFPIDARLNNIIYKDYPELRREQKEFIKHDAKLMTRDDQNLLINIIPKRFYLTIESMKCAYLKSIAKITGEIHYNICGKPREIPAMADSIYSILSEEDDGGKGDLHIFRRCLDICNISDAILWTNDAAKIEGNKETEEDATIMEILEANGISYVLMNVCEIKKAPSKPWEIAPGVFMDESKGIFGITFMEHYELCDAIDRLKGRGYKGFAGPIFYEDGTISKKYEGAYVSEQDFINNKYSLFKFKHTRNVKGKYMEQDKELLKDYLLCFLGLFTDGAFIGSQEHARLSISLKMNMFISSEYVSDTFRVLINKRVIEKTDEGFYVAPTIGEKKFGRAKQSKYRLIEIRNTDEIIGILKVGNISGELDYLTTKEDIALLKDLANANKLRLSEMIQKTIGKKKYSRVDKDDTVLLYDLPRSTVLKIIKEFVVS